MFTFSLQTVLEVRERLEKLKYKEFSLELMAWQKLDLEIKERKEKLAHSTANMNRIRQESTTPAPFHLYDAFRQRLHAEIAQIGEQQREQNQALEAKRKELVEARRAYRALEILRDKEFSRYNAAQARQERTVMDEIAASHHQRSH